MEAEFLLNGEKVICPKCKHKQENTVECESCGIVFERCYRLILKKKLNEGIALYREGNYKDALEIFKYIQKTNKYNDTELSENSADYIVKIQEKVEDESRETRLVPREKIVKYSIDEKEVEKGKDNFSTTAPTNQEQQRTFTPYAIYAVIILLIISSCYLHYEYHYKLRKVSEILSASTQDSMSELSKTTQQSFGIIAKQVDINTNKISRIEYTVNKMEPILENCNENAHSHSSYSDINLKRDVKKLSSALNKVSSIESYSFRYNEKHPSVDFDSNIHYGYMAQEVEQIFPELVLTDQYGYKRVNYIEIIPLLTTAINEQEMKIKALQQELIKLKASVKK